MPRFAHKAPLRNHGISEVVGMTASTRSLMVLMGLERDSPLSAHLRPRAPLWAY